MTGASSPENGNWLGQPKGIFLIFATDIWERFSYYGMRGLLVLFLTAPVTEGGFGWTIGQALSLYAAYTGLAYLTPIAGGALADQWLGPRRAIVIGMIMMTCGHFSLLGPALFPGWLAGSADAFHSLVSDTGIPLGLISLDDTQATALEEGAGTGAVFAYRLTSVFFYMALGLIILGTGLFKSNNAALIGAQYAASDPRRDSGYTICYMGSNLGAFLAGIIAGSIGEIWGWHLGFSSAGAGMAIGLVVFLIFQGRVLRIPTRRLRTEDNQDRTGYRLSHSESRQVLAIGVFAAFSVVFWMGFEQAGGLFNLFTYEVIDRTVFGWEVPATWFQSLNPFFLFLTAPLFVVLWARLQNRGILLSPARKFSIGLALSGFAFIFMVAAALQGSSSDDGQAHMGWMIATYFALTLGEVCLSPVGQALVSRYAPRRLVGQIMGLWFLGFGIASWLAGTVGSFAETLSPAVVFTILGCQALLAACLIFLAERPLMAWLNGQPFSRTPLTAIEDKP